MYRLFRQMNELSDGARLDLFDTLDEENVEEVEIR
jgi:hypothetical protein